MPARQGRCFAIFGIEHMDIRRFSIVLMILTIIAIAAFQTWWVCERYREEKRFFHARTDVLFREAILRLQTGHFHINTVQMRIDNEVGLVMVRQEALSKPLFVDPDSPRGKKVFYATVQHESGSDGEERIVVPMGPIHDSITIRQADSAFRLALGREGIPIPFRIRTLTAGKDTSGIAMLSFPPKSPGDTIRAGFTGPDLFLLEFTGNTSAYLLKRILPQIFFSLLLVLMTIGSFWLLYRNWRKQARLTRLKNDFIGNITHELRTPIATVSVAVEALRNFNALKDPERTQEYLEISAGELQRLSLLVDRVLKLSLFERQEIQLNSSWFDLRELVDEVGASMRLQFEKCSAKLIIAQREADLRLRADRLHITSVVYNLLDNALKYTPTDPYIKIELAAGTSWVSMTVSDNGMGIPAEYRDRIFEKFFRVPAGDRHNIKGYGLGLSYVSYVLQRHGGEIGVESREGAGSSFTVKLPRDHA
jgi:two-component system, OmpR family, phosphate regulon sensor histidine kinase PhoR